MTSVAFVVALILMVAGAAMAYPPAGLVLAGVLIAVGATMVELGKDRRPR